MSARVRMELCCRGSLNKLQLLNKHSIVLLYQITNGYFTIIK